MEKETVLKLGEVYFKFTLDLKAGLVTFSYDDGDCHGFDEAMDGADLSVFIRTLQELRAWLNPEKNFDPSGSYDDVRKERRWREFLDAFSPFTNDACGNRARKQDDDFRTFNERVADAMRRDKEGEHEKKAKRRRE